SSLPALVERLRLLAADASASGLPGWANRRTLPVLAGTGSLASVATDTEPACALRAAGLETFSVTGGWAPAVAGSLGLGSALETAGSAGVEDAGTSCLAG